MLLFSENELTVKFLVLEENYETESRDRVVSIYELDLALSNL